MENPQIIYPSILLLLLQTLHIFEVIGMDGYSLRTKSVRGTLGAGLFTAVLLGVVGIYMLYRLLQLHLQ